MKMYVKPDFEMTVFNLNESVASCPVTNTYNPVRVDCVITMHHHIFYTNCSTVSDCTETNDCDGGINYSDAKIVSYNGAEYLVWPFSSSNQNQGITTYAGGNSGNGGNRPGSDSDTGRSTLKAIISAGKSQGVLNNSYGTNNTHAGLITPDIDAVRNASI